jgi:hypothetical protein
MVCSHLFVTEFSLRKYIVCGLYGMLPPRGPAAPEDAVRAEQQRLKQRQYAALAAL